ncbi:MAG: RNA 2',3'-cyclic phosphodiesterase [Candidatus Makaraimicrobium thalassicum]|nr:MAG: RNA 2',3'-cyclic phosphodiesterase [Candidatus Omnitrophota bacterium]
MAEDTRQATHNTHNAIRSFIALELSGEARAELSRITGVLKGADADVKWIAPGSVHLTLKFLGYVPEGKIPRIAERLKAIAAAVPPFKITLGSIGVFPCWSRARVVWVGVGEGRDHVEDLAGRAEEAMAEEGFEKQQRAFSSHLTVGRIKRARNRNRLKKTAGSITVKPAPSHISRIVLFKSVLTPKGALYTPLDIVDLKG